MGTKIKIRFLEHGTWGDEPHKPIFDVEAGEEKEVTPRLAKIATDAGKAEFVRAKQKPGPKPAEQPKKTRGRPKAGPVEKAEG